jgi:hypothetical protein
MSISEPPETGTSAPGQPADPGATTNEAADGGGGPKRESSDVVQEADGVTVTPSRCFKALLMV